MEIQNEGLSLLKCEINGFGGTAVDDNELSFHSKNKKLFAEHKIQQPDISGLNEPQRRFPEEISPYATSYPLANRLYALKNPRKCHPGMIGDRVLSAKLIKMKELENELTVLKKQLNEINGENKLLRALQHRQDHALKKFEGTKGQLPQLIQSHSEEVRALKGKCKKLSMQNRELEKRLRNREMELRLIQEQNRHLQQLSKDRSLEERESLREKVDSLRNMLHELESQFQDVARRKCFEQKIHQQRLQQEISLSRELKKSLLSAEQNIEELKALLQENDIIFDTEKKQNTSKSPKEVRKHGTHSQRLPLIGQQHQLEAVDGVKESNLSTARKLSNNRRKPCPSVVSKGIKSGFHLKDPLTVGDKKANQYDHSPCDEGETEYSLKELFLTNMKINSQEPCCTTDDFGQSLIANACLSSNDAENSQENEAKSLATDVRDIARGGEMENLTKLSPKSQNAIEVGTSDGSADVSSKEDISSSFPENAQELTTRELIARDGTDDALTSDVTSDAMSDEGKSKLETCEVHHEEGLDRSKKEKLLKVLRAIDHEEWTDLDISDDIEGKPNSNRSFSSGHSSTKSKKSLISRKSPKPDLMHDLFGTIPKSQLELDELKTSDPEIAMFRDIKS